MGVNNHDGHRPSPLFKPMQDIDVIAFNASLARDQSLKSCVQPSVPVGDVLPEALLIASLLIKPAGTCHKVDAAYKM